MGVKGRLGPFFPVLPDQVSELRTVTSPAFQPAESVRVGVEVQVTAQDQVLRLVAHHECLEVDVHQATLERAFRTVALAVVRNQNSAKMSNEVALSFEDHTDPLEQLWRAVFVAGVDQFRAPVEACKLTMAPMKKTATKADVVVGVLGAQAVPGHFSGGIKAVLVADVEPISEQVVRVEHDRVTGLVDVNQGFL